MTDQQRPYRMKRRAELEQQTRARITEAAVELHGRLGPSQTSMSAVAERAGVPRSTLYRHFPDETALFAACSAHWVAANPPPDLGRWAAIEDPAQRLGRALEELYAYYRSTEGMMANLLRDEATMAIVADRFRSYREFLGHALAFTTWRSLAREQRLGDVEAVRLMCRLVESA
jgi:AcrR family transcriptional regulator